MIYSPTSEHALRALIYLARRSDTHPVRVQEIAAAEAIPRQFLSKILHDLRNKGIVRATKGPGGGYALALPPGKLTVWQVVEAVDGIQSLDNKCILGLPKCSDSAGCALHAPWKHLRKQFLTTIGAMTLEQAARAVSPKH